MTAQPATAAAAFRNGVHAIEAESGGVLRVEAIHRDGLLALAAAADAGDRAATARIRQVVVLLKSISAAPASDPARCASCHQPLSVESRFHTAIVHAAHPPPGKPHTAMTFAICADCADDLQAIQRKTRDVLRQLWDEVRDIQISTQASTA